MNTNHSDSTPEWRDQWVALQGRVTKRLPAVAVEHKCFVFSSPTKALPTTSDGTEMTETSINFITGERQGSISVLLEGFPDNGFALSVSSLLTGFQHGRVFQGQKIEPAIDKLMEHVGQIIERFKGGEIGHSLFQR